MSLKHEFNRIGHLFHNGVEKTQSATDEWTDKSSKQAAAIARMMRDQVESRSRSLVTAEEALLSKVRENPALYLIGATFIIGALLTVLILGNRRAEDVPLL